MTIATASFARSFALSRERFRAAASQARGRLETYDHPLRGPAGEALACDTARFGDPAAKRLLVMITGVHGVEHFAGSACAIDWIECGGPEQLPPDLGVLVIHAINPWGAAWCRRYTEDNVDLARNFWGEHPPESVNAAYEQIHGTLSEQTPASIPKFLTEHFATNGKHGAIEALMGGQYHHADGFAFGGTKPCWSRRTIETILAAQVGVATSVCLVEFHSGLGDRGAAMVVTMQSGAGFERVTGYFGKGVIAPRQTRETHSAMGHTTDGYLECLGDRDVASIVLEFGTYPPQQSLIVLLEDHWLHRQRNPDPAEAERIRTANLEMHCPNDPLWEEKVLHGSARVIAQALAGLASP